MTLAAGSRLGPYEIVAQLGAGGMGEVFKATDTRLDRTVAVKVLPAHVADRPDVRERFEREARAIGALNHPHICVLHDIGHENGRDFLVMEYVEGQTLASRLAKGQAPANAIPLSDALEYGIQIADALNRAHGQGIVHRDLKPGNIMLTRSGVKLLDFGLAKIIPAEASASTPSVLSTKLADLTAQGTIVGTLQYMAPEQLEGRDADARTDLFAFGAVLYEMVSGEKAFDGRSQASVIAAILERQPPPISSRQTLAPPALDRVVAGCLAKDPDDRWQTAHDLGRTLRWIADDVSHDRPRPQETARATRRSAWLLAIAALVIGGVLGAVFWPWVRPAAPAARGETRFSLELLSPIVGGGWENSLAAISRDGRRIVYRAGRPPQTVLYLRSLDDIAATRIDGTEGAANPFFASDGESIGFFADAQLKRINLRVGRVAKICDAPGIVYGASWRDDLIVFSTREGLVAVPAGGGAPRAITTPGAEARVFGHRSPVILPGSTAAVFVVAPASGRKGAIEAVELASGVRHVVVPELQPEAAGVQYLSSGHLLYEQNGSLFAIAFDTRTLTTAGRAAQLEHRVASMGTTLAQFAASESGTLVYLSATSRSDPDATLTWVSRDGTEESLPFPSAGYGTPRISPDGLRLAVVSGSVGVRRVWVGDLRTGSLGQLTRPKPDNYILIPIWSPDGTSIAFAARDQNGRLGVATQAVDRTSAEQMLFTIPSGLVADGSWTKRPTGSSFLAIAVGGDLLGWSSDTRRAEPFLATPASEQNPAFSPDGRWLAFTSIVAGTREVFVRPFPGDGQPVQVSLGGGEGPTWAPSGQEIFYVRNAQAMVAVGIKTAPTLSSTPPRELFKGAFAWDSRGGRSYDVHPKTGRFLMVKREGPPPLAQLVVVVDGMSETLSGTKR